MSFLPEYANNQPDGGPESFDLVGYEAMVAGPAAIAPGASETPSSTAAELRVHPDELTTNPRAELAELSEDVVALDSLRWFC